MVGGILMKDSYRFSVVTSSGLCLQNRRAGAEIGSRYCTRVGQSSISMTGESRCRCTAFNLPLERGCTPPNAQISIVEHVHASRWALSLNLASRPERSGLHGFRAPAPELAGEMRVLIQYAPVGTDTEEWMP